MVEINNRLCHACGAIFGGSVKPHRSTEQGVFPPKHMHHPNIQSFCAAVDAGCYICSVFNGSQGAEPSNITSEEQEPFSTYFLVERNQEPGTYMLTVQINNRHAASSNIKPDANGFEVVKVNEDIISVNTPSTQRFQLLSQWVADCCHQSNNATHTVCQCYRETANKLALRKPARLLERGTGDKQGSVRLTSLDPAKSSSFPDYVTLGSLPSASVRTLSSSLLSSMEDNWFPANELPQMIQDALTLTQHVGAHYLWTSDLSEEDITITDHSHRGDIIAGALFHIAPVFETVKRDEGILPRVASQKENPFVPVVMPSWAPGSSKFAVLDQETMTKSLTPSTSNAQAQHDIFIAPATLYCAASQLWWQCRGGSYSETFPTGIGNGSSLPSVHVGMNNLHPISSVFKNLDGALPNIGGDAWPFVERLTSLWTQVVAEFSAANYRDDRLLLLESMAAHLRDLAAPYQPGFQRAVYCTGMWFFEGNASVHQLLWHATPRHKTLEAPVPGKRVSAVPTWSWASSRAPAEYEFYWVLQMDTFSLTPALYPGKMLDDAVAEVVLPPPSPVEGNDKTLEGAALTLRGKLIPIEIKHNNRKGSDWFSAIFPLKDEGKAAAGRLVLDMVEEEALAKKHGGQSGRYFALPLTLKTTESRRFGIQGLVLRPRAAHVPGDDGNDDRGETDGIYTRCGWFHCDSSWDHQNEWKNVDVAETFGLGLEKDYETIVLV